MEDSLAHRFAPEQQPDDQPSVFDAFVRNWADEVAKAPIPPIAKLVCLNLLRYIPGDQVSCRPGFKQMLADTGLCKDAVTKHLVLAEQAGLLYVKRNYDRATGHRTVTTYRLRLPALVVVDLADTTVGGSQSCHTGLGLVLPHRTQVRNPLESITLPLSKRGLAAAADTTRRPSFLRRHFPEAPPDGVPDEGEATPRGVHPCPDLAGGGLQ
jgi:hypothetical protein